MVMYDLRAHGRPTSRIFTLVVNEKEEESQEGVDKMHSRGAGVFPAVFNCIFTRSGLDQGSIVFSSCFTTCICIMLQDDDIVSAQ